MNGHRSSNDRGTVLIITVVTMSLLAFGVLMLAGTVKRLLDVSLSEALAAEQRLVSKTATGVLDAWLADQGDSKQIFDNGAGRVWMTPIGEQPCPDPTTNRNICWRVSDVSDVDFDAPDLRGGEAQRTAKDVTVEIAVGCHSNNPDDCQRTSTITRRYEQAVTFQYQLHYDTNAVPPAVLDADDPGCHADPPSPPPGVVCDPETLIVFARGDTLNGPVRTTLTEVLYCNDPTFFRVEVAGSLPNPPVSPLVAHPRCLASPIWQGITTPPTPSLQDLLNEERIVYGGDLDLPDLDRPDPAPPFSATLLCDEVDFDFRQPLAGNCPRTVESGDLISPSNSSITIHELVLNGSATVYASGDIIICGDIEARGSNPSGGPNVIALVTEGDVILDPSGDPTSPCGDPSGLLNSIHNLTLANVAVLAPKGAIYARNWHLGHAPDPAEGPTLTIKGSIAARYLGLYGIPNPADGSVDAGWAKNFTYPDNFWLARPPWWPGFTGNEWTSSDAVPTAEPTISTPPNTTTSSPSTTTTAPPTTSTTSTTTASTTTTSTTTTTTTTVSPQFTAEDAVRYVAARDGLLSSMSSSYAIGLYGTSGYAGEFVWNADFHRNAQSLDPAIPLGEDDPDSLPNPANRQDLRDAIDALAVAAGLSQDMIDAAEGG